jgi:hypothetical protein
VENKKYFDVLSDFEEPVYLESRTEFSGTFRQKYLKPIKPGLSWGNGEKLNTRSGVDHRVVW